MDTIIYGNIYTMNRDMPFAEAVGIKNGSICYVGSRKGIEGTEAAEILDYSGKTLMPGFIDTHVHVIPSGLFMEGANLSDVSDINEIKKILKEKASETPKGEWVIGAFFQDKLIKEKRFPTRWELDEVSVEHPIFVCHNDTHPFSFNTKALELINPNPEEDGIEVDEKGELTGVIKDPACMSMLETVYSCFSDEALMNGCKTVDEHAVSNGITTVFGKDSLRVLKLREKNKSSFKAEFVPMWMASTCDNWEGMKELQADESLKDNTCVCVFADGAFDGYSASVIEPYEGRPTEFGILTHTDEQLYDFAMEASRNKMQFSCHAIGDHAIEQVLRVYEKVLKDNPNEDHRFRIEHFELPTKASIKKAAELGVALGMQPLLIEICEGMDLSGYSCFIGDRAGQCSPYRSILDEGILVGSGTDFPVTPMKPLHGARIAMTQPNASERITLMECLEMNTSNAAKMGFLEDRKGMIKEGLDADIIMLSRNPFEVSTEELSNIEVEKTFCKGKLVFEK